MQGAGNGWLSLSARGIIVRHSGYSGLDQQCNFLERSEPRERRAKPAEAAAIRRKLAVLATTPFTVELFLLSSRLTYHYGPSSCRNHGLGLAPISWRESVSAIQLSLSPGGAVGSTTE